MANHPRIDQLESESKSTIEFFRAELQKMKTGRASSGLVEGIQVDYYGTQTPLMQLGLIAVAESRLLTVQVYDQGAIESIEKAIQQAGLGLNPSRDGNTIRIPIPALNEERRKEIVKHLHKQGEEMKIAIRNHRRGAIDDLSKMKKEGEVSEDELSGYKKEIQAITDTYVGQVDKLLQEKEKEVLEV